jgi:ferredoxin
MRLEIDTAVCTGHGRCYTRAPRLVEPDDEGFPVLLVTDGEVPGDLADEARVAASSCPEGAISLVEAG